MSQLYPKSDINFFKQKIYAVGIGNEYRFCKAFSFENAKLYFGGHTPFVWKHTPSERPLTGHDATSIDKITWSYTKNSIGQQEATHFYIEKEKYLNY